jgi:hypothetical protein
MDHQFESLPEGGSHGKAQKLMFRALVLPGSEVRLRHFGRYVIELALPVRQVE